MVHVGGYKCLLAGEWCMLVAINVYCMAGEWCMLVAINVYWLASGACWWI